jgi:hypothetical protein
MQNSRIMRWVVIIGLALILAAMPFMSAGCTYGTVSGITATKLAATMVPPVNLDVYIYVDQQVPTKIPGSLTGAPVDISVQSLAIWGVVNNDTQYTIAGAITFTSAADASAVFTQIPKSADVYTKLADRTIYAIYGSGGPAESIKNAIVNNNFKKYDDKAALAEVARLPAEGVTKLGLIGIIKPNQGAINLAKRYLDEGTAKTIESVYSYAKPRIITVGVFGSQPIDPIAMMPRIANNTIWETDLGVVLSMDSVYPGFIFEPIASRFISSQGYPEVKVGNFTAYKNSINLGNGKQIPIYVNISGNHIYGTASGKESYAQTLLTSISR